MKKLPLLILLFVALPAMGQALISRVQLIPLSNYVGAVNTLLTNYMATNVSGGAVSGSGITNAFTAADLANFLSLSNYARLGSNGIVTLYGTTFTGVAGSARVLSNAPTIYQATLIGHTETLGNLTNRAKTVYLSTNVGVGLGTLSGTSGGHQVTASIANTLQTGDEILIGPGSLNHQYSVGEIVSPTVFYTAEPLAQTYTAYAGGWNIYTNHVVYWALNVEQAGFVGADGTFGVRNSGGGGNSGTFMWIHPNGFNNYKIGLAGDGAWGISDLYANNGQPFIIEPSTTAGQRYNQLWLRTAPDLAAQFLWGSVRLGNGATAFTITNNTAAGTLSIRPDTSAITTGLAMGADGKTTNYQAASFQSGIINVSTTTNGGAVNNGAAVTTWGAVTNLANTYLGGHELFLTDNTFDIGALGATRPRNGYFGTQVTTPQLGITSYIIFGATQNEGQIRSGGDGIFTLANNALNGFNRLQFGGTTAAFPALKREGGNLRVTGADGVIGTNGLAVDGSFTLGPNTNFTAIVSNSSATGPGVLHMFRTTNGALAYPAFLSVNLTNGVARFENEIHAMGGLSVSNSSPTLSLSNNTHRVALNTTDGFTLNFIQDGTVIATLNNAANLNVSSHTVNGTTFTDSSRNVKAATLMVGNSTGTPTSKAQVTNSTAATVVFRADQGNLIATNIAEFAHGGTNRLVINTNGFVGIGTENPKAALDMGGGNITNAEAVYTRGLRAYAGENLVLYASGGSGIKFEHNLINAFAGNLNFYTAASPAGDLYFQRGLFTDKLTAGTLVPTARLHVSSGTNEYIAKFSSTTFTNAVTINTNGSIAMQGSLSIPATRAGNATLVGGTVTVNNSSVTANTIPVLSPKTAGGTLGAGGYRWSVTPGTSFTINSVDTAGVLSILDTSVISYFLIENP